MTPRPHLTPTDLDLFMSRARNRPVFSEGDSGGAIYQVESGCIRLQKLSENGRRCILTFCYPGDVFGLGTHGPHDVDAEAVCTSRVSRVGQNKLARMLQGEPERAMSLMDAAYGGQDHDAEHVVIISFAQAEQKLAWFLVKLGERLGQTIGGKRLVELPMMRADIADYLGMTFETVSREMTKLRETGIIELVGLRRFTIIRQLALQNLAHANDVSRFIDCKTPRRAPMLGDERQECVF
jgi:CRP/FNR family transcriptional regulator, nitrogen fixation regulation protein